MKNFTCPKCKREGISLKDKYRASVWKEIHCPSCNARLCAHPWMLAFAYVVYTWAVISIITMARYQENYALLLYIPVVWLILDIHNVMFMPLSVLRPKDKPRPPGDPA